MSAVLKVHDLDRVESAVVIANDFNHMVAESILLGDKLHITANEIYEKSKQRTAGSIITTVVVLLQLLTSIYKSPTANDLPNLILFAVAGYFLIYRGIELFGFQDVVQRSMNIFKKRNLFVTVPQAAKQEYLVFQQLMELTRTTGESLYHSGALSELRWQSVKLHLSRYDI